MSRYTVIYTNGAARKMRNCQPNRVECPLCGAVIIHPRYLKRHYYVAHRGVKPPPRTP
ncbi:MAG: hypothetical protein QW587_04910 [Candidatus Bathyarchaeia archaeon]